MMMMLSKVVLTLLLVVTSVDGQSPLTCPAPGDASYRNKPDLDAMNDVSCGLNETFTFTSLVNDTTVTLACTTYCASCEAGNCGTSNGKATCSDPTQCTMCADPPNCNVAPLTCPVAGDASYSNKPDLDAMNDASCGLKNTFSFTTLVKDTTVTPACTTYCASCKVGICGMSNGKATCADPTKCAMCVDPPGCASSFAPNPAVIGSTMMAGMLIVVTIVSCF